MKWAPVQKSTYKAAMLGMGIVKAPKNTEQSQKDAKELVSKTIDDIFEGNNL